MAKLKGTRSPAWLIVTERKTIPAMDTASFLFIFAIDKKFADNFILNDEDLEKIKNSDPNLARILENYDKEALVGALLLYLSQSPEAFIFDAQGLKVNFDEKTIEHSSQRPKAYLVNKVNEESFYDYLRGVLCN